MKKIVFALVALIVVSCSKKDEPLINEVQSKVDKVGTTTVNIKISNISTRNKMRIMYKPLNSSEAYKSVDYYNGNLEITISNLNRATKYEAMFEAYDDSGTLKGAPFYFTTKAVDFDYDKFYSRYSWYKNYTFFNNLEFFSHNSRNHVIHAPGLSEFKDVKTYLVNETKTDSIVLPALIVADSLSFTIPDDYVSNNPRESFKKSMVGIKIKDSYQYILSRNSWINQRDNSVGISSIIPLKFKIFNPIPHIKTITISKLDEPKCRNNSKIYLTGEFMGYSDYYYWTPKKAQLILFEENGNFYNSYDYNYRGFNANIDPCSAFYVNFWPDATYYQLAKYHEQESAQCASLLNTGNYKVKIIFTMADGKKVETNLATFTKN